MLDARENTMTQTRDAMDRSWAAFGVALTLVLGRFTTSARTHQLAPGQGGAGGAADDRERGDVPGWVLVTIMTAGLVTALWLVADGKLKQLFGDALDGVTGP